MPGKYTGCIKSKKTSRRGAHFSLSLYASKYRKADKRKLTGLSAPSAKRHHASDVNNDNVTVTHLNHLNASSSSFVDVETWQEQQSIVGTHVVSVNVSESVPTHRLESTSTSTRPPSSGQSANAPSYVQICIDKLCDRSAVTSLVQHLREHDMLHHFMNFFAVLSQREISPLQLPILLALERCTFQTLTSTCRMRFHPLTKRFFSTGYKMFGGSFLEYCTGPKSFGQILTKQSAKGKFDPRLAKVNFAVPNKRHLKNYRDPFVQEILPGIIPQSLDMLENKTDQILMIDGKKLARGLRPNFSGDVQTWDLEEPKSLQEVKDQLKYEVETIENASQEFKDVSEDRRFFILEGFIKLLSKRVMEVRHRQLKAKKQLACNEKKNQEVGLVKRYQFTISASKTYLYSMYLWIEKALKNIGQFATCCAMIHGNVNQLILEGQCDLAEKANARILHPMSALRDHMQGAISAKYVKQRTPEWFQIRRTAVVTGSSAYAALGFRSKECRDAHFDEFVFKTKDREFTPEQRANMQYGADNEVTRYFDFNT